MNVCRCNNCGRKVQGQPKNWRKLKEQFGGLGQLKANYVCSRCRHYQRDNPVLWAFTMAQPHRALTWEIKNEMVQFETNTYNQPMPLRAETFKQKVHAFMEKRFIKNYEFSVVDNKLCAILIKDVPFLGSFTIKLNETNQKKEQTEA